MPTKRSLAAHSYPLDEINAYLANPTPQNQKYSHFTIVDQSKLTYKGRTLVPAEQVLRIIQEEYNRSFFGVQKLHSLLQAKYIGISQRQVAGFLRNNSVQQQHRIAPTLRHTHPRALVKGKSMLVQADVTLFHRVPLLGIVDVFTRRAVYYVLSAQTAAAVARTFQKYLRTHDKPRAVLCDNGSEFQGAFAAHLAENNIALYHGTPYNSETQGLIERLHRSLKGGLERYQTNNGTNWRSFLNTWVNQYNKAVHSSTGFSPDELHHADPDSWRVARALKKMERANAVLTQRRQKLMAQFDTIQPGDSVRVKRNLKKVLGTASEQRWSAQVYTVARTGTTFALEGRAGSFPRDSLLKIDPDKLIPGREEQEQPPPPRVVRPRAPPPEPRPRPRPRQRQGQVRAAVDNSALLKPNETFLAKPDRITADLVGLPLLFKWDDGQWSRGVLNKLHSKPTADGYNVELKFGKQRRDAALHLRNYSASSRGEPGTWVLVTVVHSKLESSLDLRKLLRPGERVADRPVLGKSLVGTTIALLFDDGGLPVWERAAVTKHYPGNALDYEIRTFGNVRRNKRLSLDDYGKGHIGAWVIIEVQKS